MNAYDFDKTIFYPDSSYCFIRWCIGRYPAAMLKNSGRALYAGVCYALGLISAKNVKQAVYGFMRYLPEGGEPAAEKFWELNHHRVQQWYLEQKRSDDLIISASPEFMLRPVCRRLGVKLIATEMDPKTGIISGENCHDTEKVIRFRSEYGRAEIEEFYSDSLTDSPMAELAARAFMVNKGNVGPWPKSTDGKEKE